MRDPEFVQKAEQIVMEYGPLPSRQIAKVADYEGQIPGRALGRSRNLYHMGNFRTGVWYLEHQVLDARDELLKLQKGVEIRREINRREIPYLPVNPNIHSFLTPFKTNRDTYTAEQFWRIAGGSIIEVRSHLASLERGGVLLAEGRPKTFRRNPDPTLDGMFGDAAEEIFKDYFK